MAKTACNDGLAEMVIASKYPALQFLMPKYLQKFGGEFAAPHTTAAGGLSCPH